MKTSAPKARDAPEAPKEPSCILALNKGNMDNTGESRRYRDALALMQAVADASGGLLRRGAYMSLLTGCPLKGDPGRVFGDVLSRVDIQKSDTDEEAVAIASRILETADRVGCPREAFAMDSVKRLLEMMYMKYDVWED